MQTVQVSPLELKIGDRVLTHGAVVEVAHIVETVEEGVRVVACISRLVGEDPGRIPAAWFETPEQMAQRGCEFAARLPAGRYWNEQGSLFARVQKIVA